MAQKKDFTAANTQRVYDTILTATKPAKSRQTYTEAEALEAMENMKTTGKKGVKMPRINMAFTPANLDYIKTVSRVSGLSMTEFVNKVIEDHHKNNGRLFTMAKNFIDKMDSQSGNESTER